jgi:iron(III) transport system permease protein
LARSGFVAGFALVFVSAMKELPITLLLSPIEYRTLATEVWTASGEGRYSNAAVPAFILVAIAALPTLLFRGDNRPTRTETNDRSASIATTDPTAT